MTTRKMLYLSILFAVTAGARPALADNWWDRLYSTNSNTTAVTPSASATQEQIQTLANSQQSLAEDQQRLNDAYSLLRQHQAAGQDTSADLANIANLQQTLRNRSQEVRQQSFQVQNPALYAAHTNYQTDKQNLRATYQQFRQDQRSGADTTASLQALNAQKQLVLQDRAQMRQSGGYAGPNGYRAQRFYGNGNNWHDRGNYGRSRHYRHR